MNKEVGVADLEVGGKQLSDARAKAKALNSHFCSPYESEDMNNIPSLRPREHNLRNRFINIQL